MRVCQRRVDGARRSGMCGAAARRDGGEGSGYRCGRYACGGAWQVPAGATIAAAMVGLLQPRGGEGGGGRAPEDGCGGRECAG